MFRFRFRPLSTISVSCLTVFICVVTSTLIKEHVTWITVLINLDISRSRRNSKPSSVQSSRSVTTSDYFKTVIVNTCYDEEYARVVYGVEPAGHDEFQWRNLHNNSDYLYLEMILSWGDSEEDLEKVTRELKDLKELVGTFDKQANELQAELRLANEEFQDLVNVRGSTANQVDEQDVILQLRLEDMSKELRYAMEMRRKNEMKILKLQKKVLLYKNELDCTLQKLEAEKQRYAMNATETKNTKDEHVQTSNSYEKLKMVSRKSVLNVDDVDVQIASHDKFTMDLIEIAFGLHEQLAKCHMERKKQNNKHEHFVAELQKTFEFRLEALQKRYGEEMEKFRDNIEKAAESTIVMLRTQRRQLMTKLMKADRDKEEANRTIRELHHQLKLLTSKLNTQKNNKENVC